MFELKHVKLKPGVRAMKKSEAQYRYEQEYIKKNITMVHVPFNYRKPEDVAMLDWLNTNGEKKTAYIKRLIRSDMLKHKVD